MKKRIFTFATIVAIAGCVTLSSCIGSFNLTNKVLDWNKSIGGKFINEVVFIAFHIVPIYEICIFADAIVFNTIEFWTDSNPISDAGTIKEVEGENGKYTIETLEYGYRITNENGEEMQLIYDAELNTWSSKFGGITTKLIKIQDEDTAVVFLPNGEEKTVELNSDGVMAFRQVVEEHLYYAIN